MTGVQTCALPIFIIQGTDRMFYVNPIWYKEIRPAKPEGNPIWYKEIQTSLTSPICLLFRNCFISIAPCLGKGREILTNMIKWVKLGRDARMQSLETFPPTWMNRIECYKYQCHVVNMIPWENIINNNVKHDSNEILEMNKRVGLKIYCFEWQFNGHELREIYWGKSGIQHPYFDPVGVKSLNQIRSRIVSELGRYGKRIAEIGDEEKITLKSCNIG